MNMSKTLEERLRHGDPIDNKQLEETLDHINEEREAMQRMILEHRDFFEEGLRRIDVLLDDFEIDSD